VQRAPHRILLVFADGIGLGAEVEGNPFVTTPTPALHGLLGGPLSAARVDALPASEPPVALAALDAVLGVAGLPQSGTGQTTLFTGVNAQAELGRHVPALPGPRLRGLIERHGMMARLVRAGRAVTFANGYGAAYGERLRSGEGRPSATSWAVVTAGLPFRTLEDLARGEALPWDVTGASFGLRAGIDVPVTTPEVAGERLARLAAAHDFTLYETFLTDVAGHARWGVAPEDAVARLDGLLAGVLAARAPELTLLLTSDHGNLEEAWHRRHTTNPVPLLAVGPAAPAFADLSRLDEVAPRIEAVLAAR
jgi:hypothetical protein